MLRVQDIMSEQVLTTLQENTVQEAAQLMRDHNVGSLIVVHNNGPIGILTERDLTTKILANNQSPHTRVEQVMTSSISYVNPEADLIDAASMMHANNIKKLPIVRSGKLVGVVTQTDIIRHLFDSVSSIERAYKEGTITPQQYAQKSSQLIQNLSGSLQTDEKVWHMICEDCHKQFRNPEREGQLKHQTCPACNSTNITYDKTPRI